MLKTSNRQPNFTPKITGKRKKQKHRISRRKKIIKIRVEINEKKKKERKKEPVAKISKTKSWFFDKISKIDKPLARLLKRKREKNHINNIRMKTRGYNR